jgi:hypothetical protein
MSVRTLRTEFACAARVALLLLVICLVVAAVRAADRMRAARRTRAPTSFWQCWRRAALLIWRGSATPPRRPAGPGVAHE